MYMSSIAHYIMTSSLAHYYGSLLWNNSFAKQKLNIYTLTCFHADFFFCHCDSRFLVWFVNCSSEALVAATAPDDLRLRPVNVDLTIQCCLGNSRLKAFEGAGLFQAQGGSNHLFCRTYGKRQKRHRGQWTNGVWLKLPHKGDKKSIIAELIVTESFTFC